MKLSTRLALIAVLGAAAVGFWARLSTRAQLTAGDHVRPLGSDDNYHMRRVRFATAHFPRSIVFDPLMNFPAGGVPIWPPLYDVMLAAPSRIVDGAAATPAAIERRAAWVPPVLASVTILVAGAIGAELSGAAGAAILALFLALCPGHVMWTQFGHTDQHVAESFFGALALLVYLRARRQDLAPAGGARRELAAGVALAAAVLAWQGAICWAAVFALSLVLEAARTRRSVLRATLLVLAAPAAIAGIATALWLEGRRPPLTYVSFGWFQPLFLAALAAGTVLIETVLRLSRRQVDRREGVSRAVVLAVGAVVLAPFAAPLFFGLARGFGYVLGRTSEVSGSTGYVSYPAGWLKGIFEARPLFADGPSLAWTLLSAAFFLTPIAIAVWARRAIRGERPGPHFALAVWGAVTLLLAVSQRLNVYYGALLTGAALVETARFAARALEARGASVLLRSAAAAVLVLVLSATAAPGLAAELKAVRVPGSDLFATFEWMRREIPHPVDPYDPGLFEPSGPRAAGLDRAEAVLAPWSLGHLVLYEAELPVVANNFGYGFIDSIRFFLAETEEEALSIARARRARWVLATDLAPRMNDYSQYLGRPGPLEIRDGGLIPTPRYFRTLQSRLYDQDGAGIQASGVSVPPLESFRLIYRSRSAIRRGDRWIPRWKVFEIVPPQRRRVP